MRVSSAPGWSPVVAPQMAMVPPGRTDLTEWLQVAAPTDSMTASTLCGSRAGFEGGVGSDGDRAVSFLFAA